jgi:hypothetical protein
MGSSKTFKKSAIVCYSKSKLEQFGAEQVAWKVLMEGLHSQISRKIFVPMTSS